MDALYEMAGDAVYAASPTALMLFEGTGQLGTVAMNWGDGFATDPAVVAAGGVQSAAPFFEKMMTKPYVNNIVISPHIYPPSVSTHNEPEVVLAPGLFSRLDASFGYLTKRGFCPAGVAQPTPAQLAAAVPGVPASPGCKTFPVVYGETGSKFDRALDVQMLDDFAKCVFFLKILPSPSFKCHSLFLSLSSRSLSLSLFPLPPPPTPIQVHDLVDPGPQPDTQHVLVVLERQLGRHG